MNGIVYRFRKNIVKQTLKRSKRSQKSSAFNAKFEFCGSFTVAFLTAVVLTKACIDRAYTRCLFLNAIPDSDFKYLSNSKAFDLSINTL